jgi:hypothetical protein
MKQEETIYRNIAFVFMLTMYVLLTPFSSKAADKTPEQLLQEARAQVKEVSLQEAKKMTNSGEKVVILESGTRKNKKEHIAGAINISRGFGISCAEQDT